MQENELKRLAGAVTMVGFRGTTAEPGSTIARQLCELHLAGVILFKRDAITGENGRNITSPQQLAALAAELRAARPDLLIAVDQEGGHVARLDPDNGHPAFPAHDALGAADDVARTRSVAGDIAAVCAAGGINLNFAPCVDVNVNPDNPIIGGLGRSFSGDAGAVCRHAEAFVEAHRQLGVVPALKHFPGHGSSRADSHLQAVDITATFDDCELLPYRELLAGGHIDVIMVGHLQHHGWDAEYPATLSKKIIGGILRKRLGYDGVVVTDCLEMAAISSHFDLSDTVALALNAGVDLLLFGNNSPLYAEDKADRVVGAVLEVVRSGRVSAACLHEHAARVDGLRARVSP